MGFRRQPNFIEARTFIFRVRSALRLILSMARFDEHIFSGKGSDFLVLPVALYFTHDIIVLVIYFLSYF